MAQLVWAEPVALNHAQLTRIGERIYLNETGGNDAYLVSWNSGETFVSAGIGHFIWFPSELDSPFTESFPQLLSFLVQNKVQLPAWLTPQTDCPWRSKAEFELAAQSTQMTELRTLLNNTKMLQVAFIRQRQQSALTLMLKSLSTDDARQSIASKFHQLAATEQGAYALIDYVNFKGEGTSAKERYQGQGWGLLQVLQNMPSDVPATPQLFSQSCERVLTQRVALSPQQDIEGRWLPGWKKRCGTYVQE